ncbi:hypothetical protein B5S30_g4902 [[Candida] boidinii]|nr:hypothetical protein B5S30_g4902 [[Candida] boidinii]
MSDKLYIGYNSVHKLCQKAAVEIRENPGKPDIIIAIGGGGFIPARIIRSFLKQQGETNIPIQAIGKEVVRTQWLDFGALSKHFDSLIGKNILIVDEVDDTRTTLSYALSELYKDIDKISKEKNLSTEGTKISIFVLHNKDKPKKAELDEKLLNGGKYFVGTVVPDEWIAYPWDASDIDSHTEKAIAQGNN